MFLNLHQDFQGALSNVWPSYRRPLARIAIILKIYVAMIWISRYTKFSLVSTERSKKFSHYTKWSLGRIWYNESTITGSL